MRKGTRVLATSALTAVLTLSQIAQAAIAPTARTANASYLGSNGRFYFDTYTGSESDIYAANPDGSGLTLLAGGASKDFLPAVSPGGLGVAFISDRGGGYDIWAMNYDGSRQRQVTSFHAADIGAPSWMPDGHILFEAVVGGVPQIFIVSPSGENLQQLTSDANVKLRAVTSPTTAKVAYQKTVGGQTDLYVLDFVTTPYVETQVTDSAVIEDEPSWTPDGQYLLYDAPTLGGGYNLFKVKADGSEKTSPQQLTSGPANNMHPVMSPDGTRIAFGSDREAGVSLWTIDAATLTDFVAVPVSAAKGFDWGMAPIIVTTAADPGPAACDAVACSLRGAIELANTRAGRDGIAFKYSDGPIHLTAALPAITQPAIIDGTTEPGYAGTPVVHIDGSALPAGTPGLRLPVGDTVIAGLAIGRMPGEGIQVNSPQNQIVMNWIGVDPTGNTASNGGAGIHVYGGTTNLIRKNVVSANRAGIVLENPATHDATVVDNLIGTDPTGVMQQGTQNQGVGSRAGANNNVVARNVISGNNVGIALDAASSANMIQGNRIGSDSTGMTAIPNHGPGIRITDASGNLIGAGGPSNVIAFNEGPGIVVVGSSMANTIRFNSIHDNGGLGIDLGADGVTMNDTALDADTGPNGLQNWPVTVTASLTAGQLLLDTYLVNFKPTQTFRIDFYVSPACDPSFYGEGAQYLNTVSTTTDATGQAEVTPSFGSVPQGSGITATATDQDGNTSEFGGCTLVASIPSGLHAVPQAPNAGAVPVGSTTVTPGIYISNDTAGPVNLDNPVITGTNASDFSAPFACAVITAGSWCLQPLSFTPSAAGLRTASLRIPTALGPLELPLTGIGSGVVSGTAQYVQTDGTTTTTTPLPDTTVTLWSGTVAIATATSDKNTAAYTFTGAQASSEFRVSYQGTVAGTMYEAAATFTTDLYGNAAVPAPPPYLNRKNHTWIQPYDITPPSGGALAATSTTSVGPRIDDFIRRSGESVWYVVKDTKPGDTVTVTLTNNSVDNTLLGYHDVKAVATKLTAAPQSTGTTAQKQFASDVSAEDMDSEDMDSEDMDSEDMDSEDMDSEDMDSEDMDSDDMDSEDMDSDDMDSEDMDSDGVPDALEPYWDVYGMAQRHALRTGSVTPGTADESVTIVNRVYKGDLYFRVRGHAGAFDASHAFKIQATITRDPACAGASLTPRWTRPTVTGGHTTLILTNTARLAFTVTTTQQQLMDRLNALATSTNGIVLDLASDATLGLEYASWDQKTQCVAQANSVVDSIRGIIRGVEAAGNALEYVVIVGPDRTIPFARRVDTAEISRESKWDFSYRPASPLESSVAGGYYLSDDAYATDDPVMRIGHPLYVPERAVGRLVETPDDIAKYLDAYVATGGTIQIDDALVTGYDFVKDLAGRVADTLSRQNVGPISVDRDLIGDTWSSDDLRNKLLGTTDPLAPLPPLGPTVKHYDLIAPQGHYSANRLKPADLGTRFVPGDIARATDGRFNGTLWMTIGCHSAHNIFDGEADVQAQPLAFAEALLAQGATVVGGTGYQYGESNLLVNSEALYLLLTKELSMNEDLAFNAYQGGAPIGKALANAKRLYLGRLLTVRGIDEKVVAVATLYGLPMLRYKTPQTLPRDPLETVDLSAETGMRASHDVDFQNTDVQPAQGHDSAGQTFDYYYAGATDNVLAPAYRPVLPGTFTGLTAVGADRHPLGSWVAAGTIWKSGAWREVADATPLISNPATDTTPPNPMYTNEGLAPSRPYLVNELDPGRQTLVFAPMQYDATRAKARIWDSAKFTVYYANVTAANLLLDAPLIYPPTLTLSGGNATATVRIRHYVAANEPLLAYATYTFTGGATGALDSATLQATGPAVRDGAGWVTEYSATIALGTADPATLRVFFQAAGANAKVATLTNNGQLYALPQAVPTVSTPKTTTRLELTETPPATTTYRDVVPVTARLTDALGTAIAGRTVEFRLGGAREHATTDADGYAHVDLLVTAPPRGDAYGLIASFRETDTELAAEVTAQVAVAVGPTALVPNAPTVHVQYSDVMSIAALAVMPRGLGLGDALVTIDLGDGRAALATYTAALGDVVLDTNDFGGVGPGTYHVTLRYAGNALYQAAADAHLDVVVDPERATVTVDPLSPMPTNAVTVSGTFAQVADGSSGAAANARVHVVLHGSLGGTVSGDATVGADGRWTVTLSATADLYTVEATAARYYTSDPSSSFVAVFDASHFVNGGGTVPYGSGRAVLAFTLRYLAGTTTPDGNMRVRTPSQDIRAVEFTWLAVSGGVAQFEGKATVDGVTGYSFRVTATDGSPDRFAMRVWLTTGGSYDSPTITIDGTVTGSITTH